MLAPRSAATRIKCTLARSRIARPSSVRPIPRGTRNVHHVHMSSVDGPPGRKLCGRKQLLRRHPEFLQVGALAEVFAPHANVLAPVRSLVGQPWPLPTRGTCGAPIRSKPARCNGATASDAGGRAPCRVTRPLEDRYFVDYVDPTERATSVSVVIDVANDVWTSVTGTLQSMPTRRDGCDCARSIRRRRRLGRQRTDAPAAPATASRCG
ncbi:MAG: MoaF N-terminal domain-containing protein [Burkholderia vietnamiensis]|nr:MoaF N-terminal domain-containing protein [Burkholderia vietnamiensis]